MTRKNARVEIAIVGAGISGIGAAIRLLGEGFKDFVILEKADSLGGTWRDNTYPGCACDVPSALYSFSFAQKPDWTRAFAGQAEILDYVRETAARFDVERFIRYGQGAERAQWDEGAGHWVLETCDTVYHARVLIACTGYLHEPIIPELPGLAEFPGTVFHSSRWNHEHDLRGERVAVIGTGASAIQFVPQIQPLVDKLVLFQRTPQWILPKPDAEMPALGNALLRLAPAREALRGTIYGLFEGFGIGFRRPGFLEQLQKLGLAHLRWAVKDPVLREKLTPDYTLGCKRVLLSNDYYPSLTRPNVEVFATGVREIRGNTVVGSDGSECEVDTIILGTGFHVTEQPIASRVFDAQGRSLGELWKNGMEAYRGTTIAGLPNLFLVLGPNLGIGHNSAFIVIESQINYIVSALKTMRRKKLARVEVRREVQQKYNEVVQRELQNTVWNTGGCSSYYLDSNGKNTVGFPWSTFEMRRLLRKFDAESYVHAPVAERSARHEPA